MNAFTQGNLSIGSFYIAIVIIDVRETEGLVWFRDYYALFFSADISLLYCLCA